MNSVRDVKTDNVWESGLDGGSLGCADKTDTRVTAPARGLDPAKSANTAINKFWSLDARNAAGFVTWQHDAACRVLQQTRPPELLCNPWSTHVKRRCISSLGTTQPAGPDGRCPHDDTRQCSSGNVLLVSSQANTGTESISSQFPKNIKAAVTTADNFNNLRATHDNKRSSFWSP
jgi:hypothetical protein